MQIEDQPFLKSIYLIDGKTGERTSRWSDKYVNVDEQEIYDDWDPEKSIIDTEDKDRHVDLIIPKIEGE